ncbi:MAG: glycine--tRNA ligase subunit beta [Eggerthellaceae bacterium]
MANEKRTLAFEIGSEEIPAFDLKSAISQLQKMVPAAFKEAGIPFDDVKIYDSTRRLIVMASGVAEEIPAQHEEYKGPKVSIAFDDKGNPTKAAAGFARGKGVAVEDLVRREADGDECIFAIVDTPAKSVADILPEVLGSFIPALAWPRSCRWGSTRETYVRPVRYLLALFGDQVIPVTYGPLTADRFTAGHRVLAKGMHEVACADDLLQVIRASYVIPSMAEREEVIRAGVAKIEAETGATASLPERTLTEVINLSEYPTPMCATFDEEFLQVPEEIIVDTMLVDQRYFPLYENGKLTNRFILVSNGDPACAETIIDGNERVVRARLSDAKFFYEEDLKKPLEAYVENLDQVVFQESLGTVKDKAERLIKLAEDLAAQARLSETDAADLKRACYLCKADLVTNAVIEFTAVQGVMGSYYAAASGETPQVAQAIGQHYRPRFAGDEVPDTLVGRLTAFADKMDTICGLFAVDQAPSGSKDPFALRRSTIGMVRMLQDGLPVSLERSVDASLATYADLDCDKEAVRKQVIDFFITRTKVMLKDDGHAPDVIDAVLACGVVEPKAIADRTVALSETRGDMPEVFENLATAYARANNLRDPELGVSVNTGLMDPVEEALLDALDAAKAVTAQKLADGDYKAAFAELASLREPVDAFFDQVMIMCDDEKVRENHLRLLNRFVSIFTPIADFGKMAKK